MTTTLATFRATATREGKWWAVEIEGVSDGRSIFTQGRTLEEAERMAAEAVALVLDAAPTDVRIDLHVTDAEPVLDEVAAARAAREQAAAAEQEILRRGAESLVALGMSQRDAARLLKLSHQRVSQLAPRVTRKAS